MESIHTQNLKATVVTTLGGSPEDRYAPEFTLGFLKLPFPHINTKKTFVVLSDANSPFGTKEQLA